MPPSPIYLNEYEEIPLSIITQTSLGGGHEISNSQYTTVLKGEVAIYHSFERDFKSTFQGKANPVYNCHGLTFASRRTGIYDPLEVWKILKDEYIPIKSEKDVLEGDVVIYLSRDETDILHSGIVTFVDRSSAIIDIKILSKVLKGKEIVHKPSDAPESYLGVIKYFRVEHKIEIRICS
jgi:hypothetical protein